MVVEINDQNFENEVIKSAVPVVVDFWRRGAARAGLWRRLRKNCRKLMPVRLSSVRLMSMIIRQMLESIMS